VAVIIEAQAHSRMLRVSSTGIFFVACAAILVESQKVFGGKRMDHPFNNA